MTRPSLILVSILLSFVLLENEVCGRKACGKSGVCFCGMVVVLCDSKNLTEIPSFIPNKTIFLIVKNNNITRVQEMDFNGLPKLNLLYLSNNKLTTIQPDALCPLTHLENLDLSNNVLRKIDERIFCNHASLLTIDLSNNKLTEIEGSLFKNLTNVYKLDLSNNGMNYIKEDNFCELHKLKLLDLSSNKIKRVKGSMFQCLPRLHTLYLRANLLSKFEDYNFPSSIKILDVRTNEIANVHGKDFINLGNLDELFLADNFIQQLPNDTLQHLSNLKVLDIAMNSIAYLPNGIFKGMSKLNFVNFTSNQLTELSAQSFKVLGKVFNMYLDFNHLKILPDGLFEPLSRLLTLNVACNQLETLRQGIFDPLDKLLFLNLSLNQLEEIKSGTFSHQEMLQTLDLHGNKLKTLPEDLLSNFTNLLIIDLSNNTLTELPENLFNNLNIKQRQAINVTVDMSRNKLTQLSANIFKTYHGFEYLLLSHNQLTVLPNGIFKNVLLVRTLDISHNQLVNLPSDLFTNNISRPHRLETLFVQGNKLTSLDKNIFRGLPNLKSLCLFHNRISSLVDNTFMGGNLQYIYLFGNNLTYLNRDAFLKENIQEIHLYGNKINNVTWTALEPKSSNTTIYLSCNFLRQVQTKEMNLYCVQEDFVPHFKVQSPVAEKLQSEGFQCDYMKFYAHCTPCKKGTYGNPKLNRCVPCPRGGFYQDEIGATLNETEEIECKTCEDGTFVKEEGATSMTMCKVCPDGTDKNSHAGFRACFCLDTYARTDRFGNCTICLEDGVDCNPGQDYKSIKYGFFWSWNFSNADLSKYKEFVSNLQDKSPNFPKSGTSYTLEMPKPHKCPRNDSCNNSIGSIEVACATGYDGWLCGKCSKSYYEVMGNCIHCPNTLYLVFEILLILCLLIIVYILIWQYKKAKSRERKNTRSIVDIVIARSKIALGFYQVVGEYLESFHQVTCSPFIIFGEFISLIQMNILKILVKPECFNDKFVFNPKLEFIIGGTFTFLLVFISLLIYVIKKQCYKFTNDYSLYSQQTAFYLRSLKSKILNYVLILMFVTYPPICTTIFQLYPQSCEIFSLDENRNHNITVLRADYEIHCKDIRAYQICAYILTGGYVFAFPAVLFFLLRKYAPRDPSPQCSNNISSPVISDQEDETKPLLAESSDEICSPIWLNFLCENYKPQYWYWEIVELARKVTQTVLITLLGFEDKVTVFLTIGISVLFLILHSRLMPMKSKFEQSLQMFALIAILINLQVAAIDIPVSKCDGFLSIALTVLNIAVILIILAEAAIGAARLLKPMNCWRILTNIVRRMYEKF